MSDNSTEPEQSFLSIEDAAIIKGWIVGEAVEGLLYGVEALLAVSVLFILLRRGMTKSWPLWLMFSAIIVMLTASTMNLVGDLKVYTVQIQALGEDDTFDPTPVMVKWDIIKVVFARISYFVGDAIVVWRGYILFPKDKHIKSLLAGCVTISLGAIVADIVLAIKANANANFELSTVLLPIGGLITNIAVTILVAYKTWLLREFVRNSYGDSSNGTKFQQMLFLLIEAGVFYCIIWILVFLEIPKNIFGPAANDAVGSTLPHLGNIYATTIILLIIMSKTHCDTTLQGVSLPPPTVSVTGGARNVRAGTTLSRSIQFRPGSTTHHTQSISFPAATGTIARPGASTPESNEVADGNGNAEYQSEKIEVKVEKTEIV